MEIKTFTIEGVVELTPRVFPDDRGYFFESYNNETFNSLGLSFPFLQDNQSFSKKGTIRGMHYQAPPVAQGKLVRVITGVALDIIVDIRKGSPTYGEFITVELSSEKQNMLYVPVGFAHGFQALTDCIFFYKCTNIYHKASEGGIRFNDDTLNLPWDYSAPLISERDANMTSFADFDSPFTYEGK